jgi:hypothetical protein
MRWARIAATTVALSPSLRGRESPGCRWSAPTMLSCSVLDGYLGSDFTPRACASNDADFDRPGRAVRASCDDRGGAVTVRADNPRLLVRSQARRDARGRAV